MKKRRRNVDVAVISDLLLQPYELDPGSVEFLIEETCLQSPDGPVQVACNLLRGDPLGRTGLENLGHFVRRASASSSVGRAFQRSLKRKGRCPVGHRKWLRAQIDESPAAKPQPAERPSSSQVARLDLKNLSGSIGEFPQVIDRVASLPDSASQLQVALGDFTYAAALAVIAQWILAQDLVNRYDFVDCSPEMNRYLDNIRFSEALHNPQIVISPDPMDWAVGITRINRDEPTQRVTEKIVDILHTFVNPDPHERQALLILISEMIENVHRHAESPVDGFAVAQVYPKKLKMGIALVDAGIGVRRSFEMGDPSIPIAHLRTDENFLREAVRLHSTSKKTGHSGYGLYLLSELIARNRGTFLLTSGGASLVGYQRAGQLVFDTYSHRPWQGTIVIVIIDLNHNLPLLDIYREMPLPSGCEDDDLFV